MTALIRKRGESIQLLCGCIADLTDEVERDFLVHGAFIIIIDTPALTAQQGRMIFRSCSHRVETGLSSGSGQPRTLTTVGSIHCFTAPSDVLDCNPTCMFEVIGSQATVVVLRDISIGDEITCFYGDVGSIIARLLITTDSWYRDSSGLITHCVNARRADGEINPSIIEILTRQ